MTKLSPDEFELRGNWKLGDSTPMGDEVCKRIEWLTKEYLVKITLHDSGWNLLFQDPNDKRYWELTYPQSELHGGGPPMLKVLSEDKVQQKYKF